MGVRIGKARRHDRDGREHLDGDRTRRGRVGKCRSRRMHTEKGNSEEADDIVARYLPKHLRVSLSSPAVIPNANLPHLLLLYILALFLSPPAHA